MNAPQYLIIHDSDSKYGNPFTINGWHAKRGFKYVQPASGELIHVGYHYLILNGFLYDGISYFEEYDGLVIPCRPENAEGAHCYSKDGNPDNDHNKNSLGICLIGPPFTSRQMANLTKLCAEKRKHYGIPTEKIMGHKEREITNKDPRIDMESLRFYLNQFEVKYG
jgi:hypothetical protein